MKTSELSVERGLPSNVHAERFVLGSILLDDQQFELLAGAIEADDFSQERHRRIFTRMADLHSRGARIDRVTVANELDRHGELQSCDGLSYLVTLDDGLPHVPNLEGYVRIVHDKATLRRAIFAAQKLMNRCMEATDDPGDILADAEAILSRLAEGRREHGKWMNPGQIMSGYAGGIQAFLQPPRGGLETPTPWTELTSALCGLHRGDLFLVAGRPSMGKSVIGMQLAHYTATRGEGTAVFSLEMTKESLVKRLICSVGRVDAQRFRSGSLDREERQRVAQAVSQIESIPLWIDETRARTIPAVTAALRKLIAKNPIRLVVIDHMQLMKGIGRFDSRHHELSEVSHALKHLAGQLDLTIVLLSQLSRECERENRRPRLSDLKETGSLEEDADVVLFVHRPEQYNRQDPSLHGQAEFIIAKQRNGATGKRKMTFLHKYQRFEEACEQGELGAGDD
jgi:replicative DNA helicase